MPDSLTDAEREALDIVRDEHGPWPSFTENWCGKCDQPMPCPTVVLCDAVDRLSRATLA